MSKPIKRKGSPFWQYDFWHKGRRYRGSTGETSRTKAKQYIKQVTTMDKVVSHSLDEASGLYLLRHAQFLASYDTINHNLNALFKKIDKNILMSELSNSDIMDYVAARRGEVSNSTVHRELTILRAIHNMAGDLWEWDVKRIAWGKVMPKKAPARIRHITLEKASELLNALPDHIALAAYWSFMTGCRKSETFNLEWETINLQERYVPVLGKGQKTRVIYFHERVFFMLANMKPEDAKGPVFSDTNLRKHWATACQEAELEDFRWHDMRHCWATWQLKEGKNMRIIGDALGHADITTTEGYAHVLQEDVKNAFLDTNSPQFSPQFKKQNSK